MKRAREQNVESAAGQQGETAHRDTTTASPDRKKPRAGRAEDYDDKEGGLEWNLVRDLPYVAFRRLLDFLSSATADAEGSFQKASGLPGVPELCRVRAESGRFVGELEWGEDVAPGEEEAFELRMEAQEKQLRALRPYHAPPKHRDLMGSVAALRLTCHAIKNAVDHALGASAQASALYAPLDQFLVDHFFPAAAATASSAGAGEAVLPPVLPLLSDSAEAARTKERFRKMADLTLGVAQARLQQSRLDEVLEYVWRSWEFAPAKLDALRQQLLTPRATTGEAPLLKVEYLRREDDYLGRSYGLGIRACLSLGLPDMPHERAEVGLWVLQAWDHRDEGWDLQVFVDLRTSSPSWKHHLKSSGQDQQDEAKEEEEEKEEEEKEEEEEEGGEDDEASAPLHVVVFDSYRSRGEIIDQTTANFTLLRKLWQCVGLGGGDEDQSWKGKEVLTTLLACLGFAWHDDVDLLWDDCDDEDADAINEHVAGIGRRGRSRGGRRRMVEVQNTLLLETSRLKHKELLQGLAPYVAQLNAFLDVRQQSAATEAKTREQVVRHVRRFIGQQRLARTESYIRQRLQGGAPWPSSSECPKFALAHVEGHQVAKQLRVVYARRFDLAPGEYSSFSDHTVEFAFPVSADALRRVGLADDDDGDGGDDDHHHFAGPLPLEVVVQVSIKSADGYTGAHEQSMVTARVVGHHPRLRAALAAKAVAVPNTALGLEGGDDAMAEEEEQRQEATEGFEEGKEDDDDDDEVVLKLDCTISDMSRSEKVMATEAIELVGRLLGLSLRPTTSTSDTTTDPDGAGEPQPRWSRGDNPDPAMETTPFARAVLAFLHEAERVATWDAEEGSFPVQSTLRQKWEANENNDDGETGAEEEDANTAEQLKSQLTQEISDLCEMEVVMRDW